MKKLLLAAVILTLGLATVSYAQNLQMANFNTGTTSSGWTLDKGTGERSYDIEIVFDKPYESRPEVFCSITAIDAANDKNIRVAVKAKAVTRDGFIISVITWGDSKVNGLSGAWFAFAK